MVTATARPWTFARREHNYQRQPGPTNIINHIALVLDGSTSMRPLNRRTIEVADAWIKGTAEDSQKMGQETRISVYLFGRNVQCLIYDMDALRLPSIRTLYKIDGDTALLDATLQAITDLEAVPTGFTPVQQGHLSLPTTYGDHGFLVFVLTDGEENASCRSDDARHKLGSLRDGFNVGALVPSEGAKRLLMQYGFAEANIRTWDVSDAGMVEAMDAVRVSTQGYMNLRSAGIRTSAGLFTPDVSHLTQRDLSGTPSLGPGQFRFFDVPEPTNVAGYDSLTAEQKRKHWPEIASFVEMQTGVAYILGASFYQLTKPEEVQPQKKVAIYQKKGHKVYVGAEARKVIGLPPYSIKVNPAAHPDYDIYIQSTSVNRKLVPGTKVLHLSAGLA